MVMVTELLYPPTLPTSAELDAVFAARNRRMLARALALTPAERLARFDALMDEARHHLENNPAARQAFIARNRHQRRQAAVDALARATLPDSPSA